MRAGAALVLWLVASAALLSVAAGFRRPAVAAGFSRPAVAAGFSGPAVAAGFSGPAAAAGFSGTAVAGFSGPAVAAGFSGPAVAAGFSGPAVATGFNRPAVAAGFSQPAVAAGFSGTAVAAGFSRPAVATGFSGTAVAAGFSRPSLARFEFSQPQMGTTARVVLYADTEATAQHLANRAFARIAELDARLSDYRPDSELMVFCRAAGGPSIPVSDDLHAVLSAAQRFARQTDGAFDVTIGPLSRLWRRARVTGSPPDAGALAAARALVGYQHLELSPGRARLAKPGMLLDLGGIAKGRAADEALRVLRDGGAPRALVALGGDIAAGDAPPGRNGWTIALAPLGPGIPTDTAPIILENAAISTSGDAEQFLEHEGTRYSHVLSPQTGNAIEGRRGVTVRARDSMTADALATAASVLGNDRGMALVDATPGTAVLIVELARGDIRVALSRRW